jgi:hypothetical protein
MIGFNHYVNIHRNYCLAYFGLVPEYVIQLRILRQIFSVKFPTLCLFIACLDDFMFMLKGEDNVVPYSEMRDNKQKFAYIREIGTSLSPPHSIYSLVEESVPNLVVKRELRQATAHRCLVCPDGAYPTKAYDDVKKLRAYAESKGHCAIIAASDLHPSTKEFDVRPTGQDKLNIIAKADWVIGVENEYLFEAVRLGIKTTLIPTGLGTNLYKFLSPDGEIFKG